MRLLNNKQERWLFFLTYLIILYAEVNFIPRQDPSLKLTMQFLVNGLVITYLFSLPYKVLRNHNIRRNIQKLKFSDNMEDYVDYVSKCAAKKPNLIWLQNEKAIALALSGRILEFEAERTALLKRKKSKKIDYGIIEGFHWLFEFFNGVTPTKIVLDTKKRTFLEKVLRLVYWSELSEDSVAITNLGQELMQCDFVLYQTIAAMILAKSSFLKKDNQKMQEYIETSLRRAPSPEIQSCVQKQFKQMQNQKTD